jgi:hypothetical protein
MILTFAERRLLFKAQMERLSVDFENTGNENFIAIMDPLVENTTVMFERPSDQPEDAHTDYVQVHAYKCEVN